MPMSTQTCWDKRRLSLKAFQRMKSFFNHFFNWATLPLRLFLILLSRMKVFTDIAIMEISLQSFDFSRNFFCKGSKPSAGSIFTSLQLIINCDNITFYLTDCLTIPLNNLEYAVEVEEAKIATICIVWGAKNCFCFFWSILGIISILQILRLVMLRSGG